MSKRRKKSVASFPFRLEWWASVESKRISIAVINRRMIVTWRSTAVRCFTDEKSNQGSSFVLSFHSRLERQRTSNGNDWLFQLIFPGKLRGLSKLFRWHTRPGRDRSFSSRIHQWCLYLSVADAKCRLGIFLASPTPNLHPSWSECIHTSVQLRDLLQGQTDQLPSREVHCLALGYQLRKEQSKVYVDEQCRPNSYFYSSGWRNGGVTISRLRRSLIFPSKNVLGWLESCQTLHLNIGVKSYSTVLFYHRRAKDQLWWKFSRPYVPFERSANVIRRLC